eukprot:TRINITY_DN184_c0_g1_i1.p1 TRINITY_DN184_c0_g1~~TRINITY_DN184_c0_g1_i1.p1  ORF type:complete len:436 (-),score=126.09 TRINITY_DN184_c0_g1_i1:47-1354(-)
MSNEDNIPDDPAWSVFKGQIADMMNSLRGDYEVMKSEIVQKEARLEQERAVLANIKELQDRTVTLNIGGRRYVTTPRTIVEGAPDSILAALFSKEYGVELDENGEIFIDREGKYFHYIMEFIRDGIVLLPDDEYIRLKVAKEAEYYSLEGMLKILRIQYRVSPPHAIDLEDIDGILYLYVWGSGGGNSNREGRGGAGGFSWGCLQLSKVLSFDLRVVVGDMSGNGGGGTAPTPTSSSYNTVIAGNGGGYSGIFRDDEPLLIAGGGGGGGNRAEYFGGAGGGDVGAAGNGPDTNRTGKGGTQTSGPFDGENSYGGRVIGQNCGSLRGGDGGLGQYDGGAGGGGGYYGGGGGGEGGGIDGPPGGGGSGFVHPDLEESGTVGGDRNNCHDKATEYGYSNNGGTIGRVVAEWESSNGRLRCEFKVGGEFRLTPLSFASN